MDLQKLISDWARVTLPAEANHLAKLREEYDELVRAPSDPLEMADVLLALLLHAESKGVQLICLAGLDESALCPLGNAISRLEATPDSSVNMVAVYRSLNKHARQYGVWLLDAGLDKLHILRHRVYGPCNKNGVSRHIQWKL